jgi:hypothetical protein
MVHDCRIYTNGMKVIVNMRQVDLSNLDLNLLKLFEALVRERSVTQAGLRLGLSQPAASRALGRLRAMLGDRLLVRGKLGLELTPRGGCWPGRWPDCWRRSAASFRRRCSIPLRQRGVSRLPRMTTLA